MLNDLVLYGCAVGLELQRGDFTSFYKKDSGNYDPYLMTVYVLWVIFPMVAMIMSF